jgi:hypothetical protein
MDEQQLQKAQEKVDSLFREVEDKFQTAYNKLDPVVRKMPDVDFAAMYKIVMEERERRLIRLVKENPFLADRGDLFRG